MAERKSAGILSKARERRRRAREPLEVRMTMRFNFGDTPEEAVTVMNDRRVPMVGSVFDSRDRILRAFALILVRTGMAQPKVAKELFPLLRLLPGAGRKK
ncbi:MAG: hypothetical protein OSA97_01250 [Nevskia sp.]|nr:hypothetical protein [Nevskia sp.]